MKNYVNEISKVLYDFDIEGLADLGCPKDEYMNEAELILKYINADMTVEEVADICRVVYNNMFFPFHSIEQFIEIAEEILKIVG
jgi:hypothetical protein